MTALAKPLAKPLTAPPAPAKPIERETYICAVPGCGRPGLFGYGRFMHRGAPGRWACADAEHRRIVEGVRHG